jgi:tRNA (cytidine/uridine-2'-O-)-methyltransferase
VHLHLVGRLGFRLDNRSLRRAGVDYWDHVQITRHDAWERFVDRLAGHRLWAFTAHAERIFTSVHYQDGDCLVFGCESSGLPPVVLRTAPEQALSIPMPAGGVRSLNLATAVGIAVYESLRQIHRW